MSTAEATREFSQTAKELGDKIVALTLKEAKELSDYLEEVHGIKAAAGGAVMMAAAPADAGPAKAAEVQTEFDVVIEELRTHQEDRNHQGRSGRHQPGPEGSQGPC